MSLAIKENYDLEIKALDKAIYAQELIVDNNEKYVEALEYSKKLRALEKEICEAYDDSIESANKTLKTLRATKKKYLDPVVEARETINFKCLEFRRLENEKRIEEEKRLQETARRQAEEIAKAMQPGQKEGESLESGGCDSTVKNTGLKLIQPPILSAPPPPKVEGISTRVDWDFVIEHPKLVPDEYWVIDEKKVRGVVKTLKGACSIPGVRVFEREGIVQRGT